MTAVPHHGHLHPYANNQGAHMSLLDSLQGPYPGAVHPPVLGQDRFPADLDLDMFNGSLECDTELAQRSSTGKEDVGLREAEDTQAEVLPVGGSGAGPGWEPILRRSSGAWLWFVLLLFPCGLFNLLETPAALPRVSQTKV
ncbi:hypothetical protein DUI87_32254 [Hirundo rustica rustica]|uniref:FOXO protein transactivation domain-containing protein n=1 Tax=Hirundo rustica rustica TaxID=333673 RepID=A0A3M0IXB3_HIRRU|nr:hypothetical protein DUI87_32254 [Hirundo rustica rustica]